MESMLVREDLSRPSQLAVDRDHLDGIKHSILSKASVTSIAQHCSFNGFTGSEIAFCKTSFPRGVPTAHMVSVSYCHQQRPLEQWTHARQLSWPFLDWLRWHKPVQQLMESVRRAARQSPWLATLPEVRPGERHWVPLPHRQSLLAMQLSGVVLRPVMQHFCFRHHDMDEPLQLFPLATRSDGLGWVIIGMLCVS